MSINTGGLYVVFDGPPSHESGRFVEVETAEGLGVRAGEWEKRADGYWTLGPFFTSDEIERLRTELAKLCTENAVLKVTMVGYEKQRDELIRVSEERDALAAILSDIAEVMNDANQDIAQIDELLEQEDYATILAARDARGKAAALREAAKIADVSGGGLSARNRLMEMADAIEKEADRG